MSIVADKSGNYPEGVPPLDLTVPVNLGGTGLSASQVQGTGASSAVAIGNPVAVGGVYNVLPPTLTSGWRSDLQLNADGSLRMALASESNSSVATGTMTSDGISTSQRALSVQSFGAAFNGTTFDRLVTLPALATSGIGVQAAGMVGQYLATLPTLTNGQYGRVQVTPKGHVGTTIYSSTGTPVAISSNTADGQAALEGLATRAINVVFNGTTWDRQRGDAVNGTVVQTSATEWETVAASATDQIMGATGAVGDLLDSVLIVPTSTTTGAVSIKDGNGSAIQIYAGGTTTLIPFSVPLGLKCLNVTNPGWKITTGAGVTAIGIGNFT